MVGLVDGMEKDPRDPHDSASRQIWPRQKPRNPSISTCGTGGFSESEAVWKALEEYTGRYEGTRELFK